jgi:hypothetical protein
MRNLDELYPNKYLKPSDLQGKAVRVWIEDAALEPIFNPRTAKEEPKIILTFLHKTKRMVLNKTQSLAVAQITGTKTWALWVGREVRLRPATASNRQPTIVIESPDAVAPAPDQDPFAEDSPPPALDDSA